MLSNIVGGGSGSNDRLAASAAMSAAAVAFRHQRRRQRSVRSSRGPVYQVRPRQSIAVYVVVRLFAVAVGRLGCTVGQRFGLGTGLENASKKKKTIVLITIVIL